MAGNRYAISFRVIASLALSAGDAAAEAETVERARTAIADLDYASAEIALDEALFGGGLDADDLAAVYLLSGRVAAAFGREEQATEYFKRLLTLAPDAALEAGLAPKITRPFERAREWVTSAGRLDLRFRSVDVKAGTATVEVVSDPLHMFERAVIVERKPLVVAAIDRYGNQLLARPWQDKQAVVPAPAAIAATTPAASETMGASTVMRSDAPATARPMYARWYTWGMAAVGTAAAAGYFAYRANNDWNELSGIIATSGDHSFGEAMALEQSGRDNARLANMGFGAAAVLAVVSASLRISVEF